MVAPIAPGTVLHHRYRLIGAAGQGKFGQTYLARDLKRSNELCVIKEFIPAETDPAAIEELRQQFQKEATVLYELQHPQLPRPRALIAEGQRLYWVREYIEGKSYGILLDEHKAQGQAFSEADILQLLAQVLPVLTYIHNRGIVHKNISPNTLILRQQDQLPVLINFGLVKELVARLQLHSVLPQDTLGDWGYVPPEQLEANRVYPSSDLFSLAVTTIVLLTGKGPEELYDEKTQRFDWEPLVNISPSFAQILRQMLHPNPHQRFASAAHVWGALETLMVDPAPSAPLDTIPPAVPDAASDTALDTTLAPTHLQPPKAKKTVQPPQTAKRRRPRRVGDGDPRASAALVTGLAILIAAISWKVLSSVRTERVPPATPSIAASPTVPATTPQPSPTTSAPSPSPTAAAVTATSPDGDAALRDRRRQLGIDFQFFTNLVDEEFYAKYPQLKDQKLAGNPEQNTLQAEWNTTANSLMDKLATLKPETRGKLGAYRRANYDEWLAQLGESGAQSSPVLDPLADERFYQLLPEQKGKGLNPRTFGQIWYAIAEEQLEAAKAKKAAEATPPNPVPPPNQTGNSQRL